MEDIRNLSIEDLKNKYELEKNKYYEKHYEIVYEEYKRFIKEDLADLIKEYINNHIYTLNGRIKNMIVVGSFFETIRLEWLKKFFRENNLGNINCFNIECSDTENVTYSLKTQYNIQFNSGAKFENLFEACMKDIPPLSEMKNKLYLNINPIQKMKIELEKQRKSCPLSDTMKNDLRNIFPNISFDSEIVPYNLLKLIVREFGLKNYFKNLEYDERLFMALVTLENMNISYEYMNLLTGIDINDIVTICKGKSLERVRRD